MGNIPVEVRNYVRGHYGKPEAPLAPELLERVGPGPANKGWEAAAAAVEMATLFVALDRPERKGA